MTLKWPQFRDYRCCTYKTWCRTKKSFKVNSWYILGRATEINKHQLTPFSERNKILVCVPSITQKSRKRGLNNKFYISKMLGFFSHCHLKLLTFCIQKGQLPFKKCLNVVSYSMKWVDMGGYFSFLSTGADVVILNKSIAVFIG